VAALRLGWAVPGAVAQVRGRFEEQALGVLGQPGASADFLAALDGKREELASQLERLFAALEHVGGDGVERVELMVGGQVVRLSPAEMGAALLLETRAAGALLADLGSIAGQVRAATAPIAGHPA
jgi:hypothetical protein